MQVNMEHQIKTLQDIRTGIGCTSDPEPYKKAPCDGAADSLYAMPLALIGAFPAAF